MHKIDKITVFDKCVDGNIEKLTNLLDTEYLKFGTFYDICKKVFNDNPEVIERIEFSRVNYTDSVFDITCSKNVNISGVQEIYTDKSVKISVTKTDTGYTFGIHSNKEVY